MEISKFDKFNHMMDDFKKIFPKELEVYSNNGTFKFKIGDFTREGDITRVIYHHCNAEDVDDVLVDGEPDYIGFDFHFIEKNNSKKTIVDITYGDHIVSSFSIEAPNKVKVGHYDGVGSKVDPDTHFGFGDKSLKLLVDLFNKFENKYKLSTNDFKFIDKYFDTYQNESAKITPLSQNESILVIDNSTNENDKIFLNNLLKYFQIRGIKWILNKQEKGTIGTIIINQKCDVIKQYLNQLDCPLMFISKGFNHLCSIYGGKIKKIKKVHNNLKLDWWDSNHIFNDINMDKIQFSFSTDYCPVGELNGLEIIGKIKDKIVSVANDDKKIYGFLFYPQNIEETYKVLDNFIGVCHPGQREIDNLKIGKFNEARFKDIAK